MHDRCSRLLLHFVFDVQDLELPSPDTQLSAHGFESKESWLAGPLNHTCRDASLADLLNTYMSN